MKTSPRLEPTRTAETAPTTDPAADEARNVAGPLRDKPEVPAPGKLRLIAREGLPYLARPAGRACDATRTACSSSRALVSGRRERCDPGYPSREDRGQMLRLTPS